MSCFVRGSEKIVGIRSVSLPLLIRVAWGLKAGWTSWVRKDA